MSNRAAAACAAVVACGLAWSPRADAQTPESGAGVPEVFATVDGTDITERDVRLAAESLRADLDQIPAQFKLVVVLDHLVEQHLYASAARGAGVDQSREFKDRLAYYTAKALHDAYIETVLVGSITDEEIETRYSEEIESLPETEEVRARHVLVDTEAEARVILAMARGGADFADLARAHSTGASAAKGGDLDYFTAEAMLPAFSGAAFALDVGSISEPVETRFGWHVIKLEDRRLRPPPPLEAVQGQMRALVLRDRVRQKTEELRAAADLEVLGEDISGPAAEGEGQ
jgi:peptidyl-prolyl cis-trans isomerase C